MVLIQIKCKLPGVMIIEDSTISILVGWNLRPACRPTSRTRRAKRNAGARGRESVTIRETWCNSRSSLIERNPARYQSWRRAPCCGSNLQKWVFPREL